MRKIHLYDDNGRICASREVKDDTIVVFFEGKAFVVGFGFQNRNRFYQRPHEEIG